MRLCAPWWSTPSAPLALLEHVREATISGEPGLATLATREVLLARACYELGITVVTYTASLESGDQPITEPWTVEIEVQDGRKVRARGRTERDAIVTVLNLLRTVPADPTRPP
jgi:hypothetical protein